MRRLPILLVNAVLVLLASGAMGWAVLLVRDGGADRTTAASTSRTVTVAKGAVTATVRADGTLEAASTATAGFETSGTVTAVHVKVGDAVAAGKVLAEIDPAAATRALALANADLDAANDALTRATAAGTGTTTATNQVTQAELAVTEAQAGLDGTKLTAPMAGTVTAVNGTVGAASTGDAKTGFIELADLSALQVAAEFAEADATRLTSGQPATVTWEALTDAGATGKVVAIDPTATTGNDVVTYGVTTTVGALPAGAKPGQSVTVSVTTGTATDVTSVNSAAVTLSGSAYSVTVQNADGSTGTRTVQVGLAGDTAYEITSGLTVGEKVVLPSVTATTSTTGGQDDRQGPPGGGPP